MSQSIDRPGSFLARATPAAFCEAWCGAVLARAGLYTLHHPFVVDGNVQAHGQSFDLEVGNESNGAGEISRGSSSPLKIEVKSINQDFTCVADYPFEKVLVCSLNSWNRKGWGGNSMTPRDFLFVSKKTGNILWLPTRSPVSAGEEVHDSTRNELYKAIASYKCYLRPLQDFVEYVQDS